jgi:hypothetical protein
MSRLAYLNEKEWALNTLLFDFELHFEKHTTKENLTDYGFVGRDGAISFTVDEFSQLMKSIQDAIIRIYVKFANEGQPEWLQRRRCNQYGLSITEE